MNRNRDSTKYTRRIQRKRKHGKKSQKEPSLGAAKESEVIIGDAETEIEMIKTRR